MKPADAQARFELRRSEFARAAARLAEAAARPADEITRDAVIQRFEFSAELLWKALQAWLAGQGVEAGSPRQIVRLARANGAVETDDEADLLLAMVEDRNLTSHTYREALAAEIHGRIVRDYLPAFRRLDARLAGLAWS